MTRKKNDNSGYRSAAKELALLVLPACVLLLWLLKTQAERPLDVTALKIHVARLGSLSSEAGLLAERSLATPVTANYFNVHTRMLREKIDGEVKELHSSEPGAGLESQYHEAGTFSQSLAVTSQMLAPSFHEPAAMRAAMEQLAQIESLSKKLEQTLARAQE
jgi:hypothetical protein